MKIKIKKKFRYTSICYKDKYLEAEVFKDGGGFYYSKYKYASDARIKDWIKRLEREISYNQKVLLSLKRLEKIKNKKFSKL